MCTTSKWNLPPKYKIDLPSKKAVLRGKFIATNAYIRKIERSQINNFTPKKTKKEQTEPEVSRKKEMIKFRAEINDIETRKDQWSLVFWQGEQN